MSQFPLRQLSERIKTKIEIKIDTKSLVLISRNGNNLLYGLLLNTLFAIQQYPSWRKYYNNHMNF